MTLVWRPGFQFDDDASTYIEAVEAADTQALETGVRYAINDFVIGCKNDGIWDAIKASCILAGARTLSGALVPLVGAAPTNYNFVSGDYNRETGLKGDRATKYLDSNRNNNADPQDNQHISLHVTLLESPLFGQFPALMGCAAGGTSGATLLGRRQSAGMIYNHSRNNAAGTDLVAATGFIGVSRSASSAYQARSSATSITNNIASQVPFNSNIFVFATTLNGTNPVGFTNSRIAFYSIGESLDLAALDTRVSDLITAIGAAIP